jgi:hypothetical protein
MRRVLAFVLVVVSLATSGSARAAVKESYIHISIHERAEIGTLTKLVDIANVQGNDVWAFASDAMLKRLKSAGYGWDALATPGRDQKIAMASSADEVRKTWQSYPSYGQYLQIMRDFVAAHADLCRLVEIGTTQMGRKLLALKITDHPDLAEDEPEVLFTATLHGNEPLGFMLMLRLIDELLNGYGRDPRITNLVDNVELWVNPLANPDGTYAGGDDTVKLATRSTANGVNLNRNFPDFTTGDHPDGNEWTPETVAFMDFARQHHTTLAASFHTGNEVVNYPWDSIAERHPEDAWFAGVARAYARQAQADGPGHYMTKLNDGITNGFDWFQVSGGRQDYMIYFHGSREVTVEMNEKYLVNGNEIERMWTANRSAMLGYIETSLTGVHGLVTDNRGRPLRASVQVLGLASVGADVSSDDSVGDYHRMLLPGAYRLRFFADGYAPVERDVIVPAQGSARIDVVLSR